MFWVLLWRILAAAVCWMGPVIEKSPDFAGGRFVKRVLLLNDPANPQEGAQSRVSPGSGFWQKVADAAGDSGWSRD
jgi:hypothetical protein